LFLPFSFLNSFLNSDLVNQFLPIIKRQELGPLTETAVPRFIPTLAAHALAENSVRQHARSENIPGFHCKGLHREREYAEAARVLSYERARNSPKAGGAQAWNKRGDHSMTNIEIANVGQTRRDRAIVMGGSMAGLAAARVLSDHFREVILVERDQFGALGEHRRGVPQGRHTHGLLAGGLRALEGFFPRIFEEARRAGGLGVDLTRDAYWCFEGGEYLRFASDLEGLLISRPLLEGIIRERVRRIPNVHFWDGCQVEGFVSSDDNRRITGIQIGSDVAAGPLVADLVVDATGRGSRSPIWLEAIGYRPPTEDRIEVNMAYATCHFVRTPDHLNGASFASIPATPNNKRGGVIVAQEGNRWIVTLSARSGETVPTGLESFIEFSRKLPAPHIYGVISCADAIGEPHSARFPASVRRRYEHMNRFPEGFLVVGDAICSFNPVYGQGMTVAVLEAVELDKALRVRSRKLARSFFSRAAKIVDSPWRMAAGNDLRMPDVPGKRTVMDHVLHWYFGKLNMAAGHDRAAVLAFQKARNLLAPLQSLLKPALLGKALSAAISSRQVTRASARAAQQAA
jgi:2-polyprenyl-6-methoxyphenol hydroxylase-like FAD-dependent oxidoreductase